MKTEKLKNGKQNPTSHIALHTSQKGITLIALIITIIVMLILVGVSVTVALDGGLFTSAKDAVDQTQIAAERESLLEAMMGAIGNDGTVDLDKLSSDLPTDFEEVEEERTETTRTYLNTKSGNKYTVSVNREIEQVVETQGGDTGSGSTGNGGSGSEEEVQTGTALTNTPNAILIGDVVYVGNPDTKTATVYGSRGDIDYNNTRNVEYGTLQITSGEISIASKVEIDSEEYTVTEIGFCAFLGCEELTNVTIPSSIVIVGASAFNSCTGLTEIIIPSSVTYIGDCAFCVSGLTEITIPSSVTSMGAGAFTLCQDLKNVTIEEGILSIGEHAFSECVALTQITIPASVTEIGDAAFWECCNLEEITVYWPNGIKPDGWLDDGVSDWAYEFSGKIVDGNTGVQYN